MLFCPVCQREVSSSQLSFPLLMSQGAKQRAEVKILNTKQEFPAAGSWSQPLSERSCTSVSCSLPTWRLCGAGCCLVSLTHTVSPTEH